MYLSVRSGIEAASVAWQPLGWQPGMLVEIDPDYMLVDCLSRPEADGRYYKALDNSMAAPVMRWIGERIAQLDAILHDGSGDRRQP